MSKLKDGYATGRIHKNMMEVSCYVSDYAGITGLVGVIGSRWVPLDPNADCRLPDTRRVVKLGWVMEERSAGRDPVASVKRNDAIADAATIPNRRVTIADYPGWEPTKDELDAVIKRFHEASLKEDAKGEIQEFAGFSIYGHSASRKFLNLDTRGPVKITLPTDVHKRWVFNPDLTKSNGPVNIGAGVSSDANGPITILPKKGAPVNKGEHSGGNVNYYSVPITNPKRSEREPYIFEVEDLIQALNLGFHEGTVLKSLVRSATERELGLAKQGGDAIRDAEKMVHSSQEILRDRRLKKESK